MVKMNGLIDFETKFLEILGERVLVEIAEHNLKAFKLAHAILNHLELKLGNKKYKKKV